MTSGLSRSAVVVRAPAKVNLTLEVLGKRPDGFHELRSVFAALDLHDRLAVYPAPDIVIECDHPELATTANLAWRAADALRRDAGTRAGVRIVLEKHIPLEAGLGGGSADAAAALVAVAALWNLGYPRERLRDIGATIGSDVPFFLGDSPLALVTGRGEVLHPLPVPPALQEVRLVLLKPPVGISAGAVYRAYPPSRWGNDTDRTSPWVHGAQAASRADAIPAPFNDLEAVALEVAPEVAAARDALVSAGAPHAVMSGSGSTFFACVDALLAERVVDRLRAMPAASGWFVGVTRIGTLPLSPV
jgi:4-diphosphocytidyl-2-C-methyl-D-erythritol kinase